jgi:metal-responsive CopG/Arc/MetJ family transcriptional regulator
MVNILKVEGEDKYCVEGIILKGDTFEFSEIFMKMKTYFGGHANASESS